MLLFAKMKVIMLSISLIFIQNVLPLHPKKRIINANIDHYIMALVNDHFLKLPNNYLFADIAKKVNAFKATHPKVDVISLGIGDVTQPLAPAVIEAIHKAADEMATRQGFRGYGPEQGYDFLRDAISMRCLSTMVQKVILVIYRSWYVGITQ